MAVSFLLENIKRQLIIFVAVLLYFFSYHKNVSVNQDQNITSGAVIFSIGPGTEKFVEFGCYYRVGIPLISKVFTGGGQNVLLMTFFP